MNVPYIVVDGIDGDKHLIPVGGTHGDENRSHQTGRQTCPCEPDYETLFVDGKCFSFTIHNVRRGSN